MHLPIRTPDASDSVRYAKSFILLPVLISVVLCHTEAESCSSETICSKTRKREAVTKHPNIAFTVTERGLLTFMPTIPFYLKALLMHCKFKDKYGVLFGRNYADILKRNITAVGNDTVILSTLMEPNLVNLDIQKLSVTEDAFIRLYNGRSGKSSMELQEVRGNVIISLTANQHGMLVTKVAGCDLSIGKVKITYTSTNGKVTILNPTRIERRVKDSLNGYICDDVNTVVSLLDARFRNMFKEQPMAQTTASELTSQLFISRILRSIHFANADNAAPKIKRLIYVQRLFEAPKFASSPQSASFLLTGMICDRQHCGIGSSPVSVPNIVKAKDKMINLYVSDDVAQTFLQSMFDLGLLNMSFTGKNFVKRRSSFHQPCLRSTCLDILPSWFTTNSNEKTELKVYHTKVPSLQYKSGKAVLSNEMKVLLYSRSLNSHVRKILLTAINATFHLRIAPTTGRVFKVNAQTAKMEVSVLENYLMITDEELKQLVGTIKQAVHASFQVLLDMSFELRASCATMENLHAEFHQGSVFLAFDLILNDQCLIKKLTAVVQQ
ncbi:hypothetical protein M514_25742 [Trichuris suis]|uniref:Lipid-binding serum glycoprotein C-terminal domain-containing protein n=1 Tax=Trichuris suis TaxID=68888 RepID=A0A085LU31_9BILA|nr:hypothetical protein M513_10695 [Trichuris suis]KFD48479.1 hypothetical protein M513_10697 [Trichuris suis]KFD62140.1 hypothetical protein M514_25742 [Trichuris suis]